MKTRGLLMFISRSKTVATQYIYIFLVSDGDEEERGRREYSTSRGGRIDNNNNHNNNYNTSPQQTW